MIAFLQGQRLEDTEDGFIINVRGVGYEVHCSANTSASLAGTANVQLWIHTHVREDALTLFGFATKAEKNLFLSLVKVNGIGPKVALKILSGAPLSRIVQMIDDGDVRGLSQLPKVGKKTAEQIILELKGKLVVDEQSAPRIAFTARNDIVSALVNLGFRIQEVEKAVDGMDPALDFEEGVKAGLSLLSSQA